MRLVHGSRHANITTFALFDYVIPTNEKPTGEINNGADASGPGIYAFPGDAKVYKDALLGAATYAGEGGTLYVLEVDVPKKQLANRRDPDEIDSEIWADVVRHVMASRRLAAGYNEDGLRNALQPFAEMIEAGELVEPGHLAEAMEQFGEINLAFCNPAEAKDGWEWLECVVEEYAANYDPCQHILHEGGPDAIADYAINGADNLWETLCRVWEACAVHNTGIGTESHNKTFQDAVKAVIPEEQAIAAAQVDGDRFFVVFDTDAITIERRIVCERSMDDQFAPAL